MKDPRRSSILISSISFAFVLLFTLLVVDWHSGGIFQYRTDTLSNHRYRRMKVTQNNVAAISTDDESRDDRCREYLVNFLNGTTDGRDECEGMKNAYQAADCEDSHSILPFIRKHHHHHNDTDDGVVIDDYFEAWQCCSSIYTYYTKHCHRPELASFQLLGVASVLVFCGLVMSLLKTFQVQWVPDAAACILVGATVGGVVRFACPTLIQENMSFDNDFFLHILLPPIIFQAALNIDKQAFRRDLFPILTFAVGGTVLSAVLIGFTTFWLSSALSSGVSLPLLDSLVFGSLISSIDPVATLGILSGVGVSHTDTLYTLVFGESLLNDGVSIVLFDTMVRHLGDNAVVDRALVHEIAIGFFKATFASLGIGLSCGAFCTVYFWALRRKHTAVVETALFFSFALIPFYIADGLGYSGILAIMAMGFFTDYFVIGGSQSDEAQWMAFMEQRDDSFRPPDGRTRWYHVYRAFRGTGHLSSRSRHHVGFVAEVIASVMEMSIFAYLGAFLFNDKNFLNLRLNSTAIFGCIISRTAMVVLFSLIINLFVCFDVEGRIGRCFCCRTFSSSQSFNGYEDDSVGSNDLVYLDRRTQQILVLAGVRGAVSFALVENIPVYDAVRKTGSHFKAELKAMTSSSILFTVFVFGALTYFLVKRERDESPAGAALRRHLLHDDEPLSSRIEDGESHASSVAEST